jgi:hypothetical protein
MPDGSGNWPSVLQLAATVGIPCTVPLNTKLPLDDEGCRLLALYEASKSKEIVATYQLLYLGRSLPHETYMRLVGALGSLRTECNDKRLAVGAHRKKMRELLTVH